MNLYIRMKDGKPFEHPILEDNLLQVFPNIDLNNLPSDFSKFERVPEPVLGVYEISEGVTYELIDGIIKDVWYSRPMTEEEKITKQNEVKQSWSQSGYPSWIFDEATCSFKPPVPIPDATKPYYWNEPTQEWLLYDQEKQI